MSDAQHQLHKETQAAKALRANLADIIGADEEAAELAVASETNLNEAIDAAVKLLVDDVAAMKGLNEMLDLLSARKDRLEARIGNYRTALAAAMEQAGRKKVEHPAVTLSMRATAAKVVITDEAAIPSEFWIASEPRLDKRAILSALKDKRDISGATLSNGGASLALIWS